MDIKKLIAILLSLPIFAVGAESGYITQSLNIGIHENASLKSTILKLVPSGTELEILERDDHDRARVRTIDGMEGWVDARYLKPGIPAPRRVKELEEELLQAATELAGAREQVAELQYQLNKSRAESAAAQAGIAPTAGGGEIAGMTSDTLRELQGLAEENQSLKQRVAELEAVQTMAIERAQTMELAAHGGAQHDDLQPDASGVLATYTAILRWPPWKQILLGSVILLATAVGGFVVDWDVRRRHGGFRV